MQKQTQIQKQIKTFFKKLISIPWSVLGRLRRSLYSYSFFESYSFHVPIISVGNISFGGTGKTPMVIWLSRYLEEKSLVPMILTRGYKGGLEHSSGILLAGKMVEQDPRLYGDEPLLIAKYLQRGAVVIGKNRVQNFKKYFTRILPDVVILDDGFQYLPLVRDLNIVLFDATMDLDLYQVVPGGYLREGLHSLQYAQVIAIGRSDLVSSEKLQALKNLLSPHASSQAKWIDFDYEYTGLYNFVSEKILDIADLKDKKVLLLAGLANPFSFFKFIEEHAGEVLIKKSFPDHYDFKYEDIADMLDFARENNAIIVTTEKDIVKIRNKVASENIFFLGIQLKILSGEEAFLELLGQAMKRE